MSYPEDLVLLDIAEINFTANTIFNEEWILGNSTLFIDDVAQETQEIDDINQTISWEKNLPDGEYTWYVLACSYQSDECFLFRRIFF